MTKKKKPNAHDSIQAMYIDEMAYPSDKEIESILSRKSNILEESLKIDKPKFEIKVLKGRPTNLGLRQFYYKFNTVESRKTEKEKTMKLKFVYANGKPYHASNVVPGSFTINPEYFVTRMGNLPFSRCLYSTRDKESAAVNSVTNFDIDISDCIAIEIHKENSVEVHSNPAYDVTVDVKTSTKRSRIREHNLELKKKNPKKKKVKKKENPEKYMTEAEKIEHREYHKAKKLVREMEAKNAQQKPKKKAVGSKSKQKAKTGPKPQPKFGSKSKQKARAKSTVPVDFKTQYNK